MAIVIPEIEIHPMWKTSADGVDISRQYSANTSRLLQNPDRLKRILEGKTPSPDQIHLVLTNRCNLDCPFCCCAGRRFNEELRPEVAKRAIDSFAELGTRQIEITGGGEPTLAKCFNKVVEYAHDTGYTNIGVITNGKTIDRVNWDHVNWVRVGMYGFHEGYDYNLEPLRKSGVKISGGYIWDMDRSHSNPNVRGTHDDIVPRRLAPIDRAPTRTSFSQMLEFVNKNKIPTRITANAVRSPEQVIEDNTEIRSILALRSQKKAEEVEKEGRDPSKEILEYGFVPQEFNPVRPNDHCYMAMVKPLVYPLNLAGDGMVYDCPCTVYAEENGYRPQKRFEVCPVDQILAYYNEGPKRRRHSCSFCQFADQNRIIDEMLMPTS